MDKIRHTQKKTNNKKQFSRFRKDEKEHLPKILNPMKNPEENVHQIYSKIYQTILFPINKALLIILK